MRVVVVRRDSSLEVPRDRVFLGYREGTNYSGFWVDYMGVTYQFLGYLDDTAIIDVTDESDDSFTFFSRAKVKRLDKVMKTASGTILPFVETFFRMLGCVAPERLHGKQVQKWARHLDTSGAQITFEVDMKGNISDPRFELWSTGGDSESSMGEQAEAIRGERLPLPVFPLEHVSNWMQLFSDAIEPFAQKKKK